MKPLGYYTSSESAVVLENIYGSHLETMSDRMRWAIVLMQAYCNLHECPVGQAFDDLEDVLELPGVDMEVFNLLDGDEGDIGISNALIQQLQFASSAA